MKLIILSNKYLLWGAMAMYVCSPASNFADDSESDAASVFAGRKEDAIERLIRDDGAPERKLTARNSCKRCHIYLEKPFCGNQIGVVTRGHDGEAVSLNIKGAFRRGLPRSESLNSIKRLRAELSEWIGLEIPECQVSTAENASGLKLSEGGERLWMDIDRVYAMSVLTNGCIVVSLCCSLNPPLLVSIGDNRIRKMVDIGSLGSIDSRLEYVVEIKKLVSGERTGPSSDKRLGGVTLPHQPVTRSVLVHDDIHLKEFYGVAFGVPSGCDTRYLDARAAECWSASGGVTNWFDKLYWERRTKSLRPLDCIDFAIVTYSYETVTAESVSFYGTFDAWLTTEECIAKLDRLASDIDSRYGIVLECNAVRHYPLNRTRCSVDEERTDNFYDVNRYCFDESRQFYNREFNNNKTFVRLVAGTMDNDSKCVILDVLDLDRPQKVMDEGVYWRE